MYSYPHPKSKSDLRDRRSSGTVMTRSMTILSTPILLASLILTACTTAPPTDNVNLGPNFGLVKKLTPRFESETDFGFAETKKYKDGEEYTGIYPGLVYKCAGREQEYFTFSENDDGKIEIHSRTDRRNPPLFPDDLLRAFHDRSKASNEDALQKIPRFEPGDSLPFGLADFIAFEDGWLIAYDVGEFGGALIWLPKQGDSYFVSTDNTSDLEQVGDVVYAAQGLDHLSLRKGAIKVAKKYRRNRLEKTETGKIAVKTAWRWLAYEGAYVSGSTVNKVAVRDDLIVGLTNYGLIVVGPDGVVRYNDPNHKDHKTIVQKAEDLFIDHTGRVYVGGPDMIGVYSGLPERLVPELYARKNCKFIFEDPPKNTP